MDGPPRCAFLEIACAVRESKDPDGRAICTMAGQMDICGQMAERICGGRETLRYVSVEVMSCHHNPLEKREALREALAWSANPGRAVLCAAVSRLARVDDEAIAAIRTVTMGGGRVFFAASAASVAAAPKGALLSQLNATAASGCSGTAQTSVAWQLADFLEQRATVSPPPARLLAARATLERSIPPGTAIVTVGRVSPGAKQAVRSLKRQQLGTGLVASGLRHTFYGLSGDVQGQSTTDSLNSLPLKILIDKQVKEWLKLPPEQQPKHGLVLAWGAERPTRSLTQLSELCEYCRGLAIPVSLAICAPPLPLLQGRSAKRLLQLSLADAPVKPAAAEREYLQQLLADSESEDRLSGLLVLHLGASTLATPECAASRPSLPPGHRQSSALPLIGWRPTWTRPRPSSAGGPTTRTWAAPPTRRSLIAASSISDAGRCRRCTRACCSPPSAAASAWAASRRHRRVRRRGWCRASPAADARRHCPC